jgi:hypothetical protein
VVPFEKRVRHVDKKPKKKHTGGDACLLWVGTRIEEKEATENDCCRKFLLTHSSVSASSRLVGYVYRLRDSSNTEKISSATINYGKYVIKYRGK